MNYKVTDSSPMRELPEAVAAVQRLFEQVGTRVRAVRARRGMTRRDLAGHADVSERYLAQLESGRANASLGVLFRVSRALGVSIDALVTDGRDPGEPSVLDRMLGNVPQGRRREARELLIRTFDRRLPQVQGVALVGLRGGGKSTLGQLLAQRHAVPFVRLTEKIAEISGMQVGELIALAGQNAYRRAEYRALAETIERFPVAVVEAGGSLVSEAGTYELLLRSYFTVWIRARPEQHMQRVIDQGDTRPMAGSREAMADLRAILRGREMDYRRADVSLSTSGRSVAQCADELDSAAGRYLAH